MACTDTDTIPNETLNAKIGDTFARTVKVSINSVEEELIAGDDIIYFSVKLKKDSTSYVIQKVITTFTTEGYANILLTEEETSLLTNKKYEYDCQWSRTSTNFVKTLFEGILSVNTTNITEEGA